MSFRFSSKPIYCAKYLLTTCNQRKGSVTRSRYSTVAAFNREMMESSSTVSSLHSRNSKSAQDLEEMNIQKTELLKKLEVFQWLGNKTACYPVNGNKVLTIFYFCNGMNYNYNFNLVTSTGPCSNGATRFV